MAVHKMMFDGEPTEPQEMEDILRVCFLVGEILQSVPVGQRELVVAKLLLKARECRERHDPLGELMLRGIVESWATFNG